MISMGCIWAKVTLDEPRVKQIIDIAWKETVELLGHCFSLFFHFEGLEGPRKARETMQNEAFCGPETRLEVGEGDHRARRPGGGLLLYLPATSIAS